MKTISFISDAKLSSLIDQVSGKEQMNRSLLIRSILFNFFNQQYPNLVEKTYE